MRFCGFCGMGTGLCGSFFVEWPVMALLHEIGLCNNNNFSRTWFFFRACLDCFQSPQNQHVDRVGSLKHCFAPPNLPLRASSSRPSSPKTNALTIVLQDPCLWRISPSYSLSLSELAGLQGTGGFGLGCGCGKKNATWKIVFSAQLWWTSQATFQALKHCFFPHSPWKMKWNEPFSQGFKNRNLRDPGPQAFGFLFNSRAVIQRWHWKTSPEKS